MKPDADIGPPAPAPAAAAAAAATVPVARGAAAAAASSVAVSSVAEALVLATPQNDEAASPGGGGGSTIVVVGERGGAKGNILRFPKLLALYGADDEEGDDDDEDEQQHQEQKQEDLRGFAVIADHFLAGDANGDAGSGGKNGRVRLAVDEVVLCTGYDYSFPFLSRKGNANNNDEAGRDGGDDEKGDPSFLVTTTDRRVHPLYLQLFHAR
jgi:hypothetical protein